MYHPEPSVLYLTKVPEGVDVQDWDGDRDWFNIADYGPTPNAQVLDPWRTQMKNSLE